MTLFVNYVADQKIYIEEVKDGYLACPRSAYDPFRTLFKTFSEAAEALGEYHASKDLPLAREDWYEVHQPSPVEKLDQFRASIDNLDAILLHTLAERFKVTQAVGKLKAENDMPPSDKAREARQIARLQSLAEESGLDPAFAEKFLNFIVAEVIRHHESFRGNPPTETQETPQS